MKETRYKLNTGLFILLLIVFFPGAIAYPLILKYLNSRVGKPPYNGFISRLVFPIATALNAFILLAMEIDFIFYILIPVAMCAAMITFTFLNKDKNQLLFNLLYVAAMVFAFSVPRKILNSTVLRFVRLTQV